MLHHRLRISQGEGPQSLGFVGGVSGTTYLTQTHTVSLTSLSGGLSSSASAKDFVVLAILVAGTLTFDPPAGYTKLSELYKSDGGNAFTFVAFYKRLTSDETSVQYTTLNNAATRYAVHVWRGTNVGSPLDAAYASASGDGVPDAPSITTSTTDTVVLAIGGNYDSSASMSALTAPSGMTNLIRSNIAFTAIAIASISRPIAGAYDPPIFGGGEVNAACFAYTLALRHN